MNIEIIENLHDNYIGIIHKQRGFKYLFTTIDTNTIRADLIQFIEEEYEKEYPFPITVAFSDVEIPMIMTTDDADTLLDLANELNMNEHEIKCFYK